jgi:hypothetical protein
MAPGHRRHLDDDQAHRGRTGEGGKTSFSLTMREDHEALLRAHLLRGDGAEHAAYVLCHRAAIRRDPWDREAHEKYLSADVIPVTDDQVLASTPSLITWSTASFVRALRQAAARDQIVAVVHNHPAGMTSFSTQDDTNEPDLVQLAVNRNGEDMPIRNERGEDFAIHLVQSHSVKPLQYGQYTADFS